jgi:hypothetical protein
MPEQQPVYVVVMQDRHTDPNCEVFMTSQWAIGFAQRVAARYPDAKEEPIDGWLYHASLTDEGDAVWVVDKNLHVDEEVPDAEANQ